MENTNTFVHGFGGKVGVHCLYKAGREKVFEDGNSGLEREADRRRDSIVPVDPDRLNIGRYVG